MNEKLAKKRKNEPKYELNTAWTSSHGQTTQLCQFGRLEHGLK
ncbi:hypothetical protein F383_24106 [Gossypium arboreum]|uniref:Uncharacterized protein n=1 Tax=Gossypium arboreum TaxID=29729 RepID=A0A0B0P1S8_GOSAR|nr:hypothetical protein F383_24106 [Gossypium arboreum]